MDDGGLGLVTPERDLLEVNASLHYPLLYFGSGVALRILPQFTVHHNLLYFLQWTLVLR